MSRSVITLSDKLDRSRAINWIERAPAGTRVEFKAAQRSLAQNDRMWAMLTEVATQVRWHGLALKADDWKLVFLDALKRELRTVPNIDGTGIVVLSKSSSDLSKSEMSDLIELIHAFGAERGVVFRDDNSSQPESSLGEAEATPAAVPSPGAAAGTNSSEPDAHAGVQSLLAPNWQRVYLRAMDRTTDKPGSIEARHGEALDIIGREKISTGEREWIKSVYRLRERFLRAEITKDDYDAAVREMVDG